MCDLRLRLAMYFAKRLLVRAYGAKDSIHNPVFIDERVHVRFETSTSNVPARAYGAKDSIHKATVFIEERMHVRFEASTSNVPVGAYGAKASIYKAHSSVRYMCQLRRRLAICIAKMLYEGWTIAACTQCRTPAF